MDNKVLWLKLSASINYFLKDYYDRYMTNEELLEDYINTALDYDDFNNTYMYLDKKTFEYIELDNEIMERIKTTFVERVKTKRIKYNHLEPTKKSKVKKEESSVKSEWKVINLADWINNKKGFK